MHEYAGCTDYPGCALCAAYEVGYQAGKDKACFEVIMDFGGDAGEARRAVLSPYMDTAAIYRHMLSECPDDECPIHLNICAVLGAYGALQMVGQQLADKAALN